MGAASTTSDDSGVVEIGSVLDGRYRIDAVLGTGGMGRVYRGEHTGIGRAVAIKVLHSKLGGSKEATSRFQREALASGRLDHPNIVGVSDFGVLDSGSLYLVMEALDGEALGARLEREKRVPWLEAVKIITGVLNGLRHAHDRGVVHRDIKPDNVFLANKDGEQVVKILDFGIAKLFAGNSDDPATTRAGLTVGTPAYLSPEQAVGGAITPASDLYSTSVVLYEMIVGRVPFDESDPLAMLTAHVSREPPLFSELAPDVQVPRGLEDLVRHGMAKVSTERMASANEYLQGLREVLRRAGQDTGVARVVSPVLVTGPQPLVQQPASGPFVTPMPFAQELGTAPTATLPHLPESTTTAKAATRYQTAPSIPIPKNWIKIGIGIFAVAIVISVASLLLGRHDDSPSGSSLSSNPLGGLDRDTRLKAALHDLESGASCTERKAAIPMLVELDDERAIPALKKARYRMTGGLLGIGESNSNSCLKADAEAAIKALSPK